MASVPKAARTSQRRRCASAAAASPRIRTLRNHARRHASSAAPLRRRASTRVCKSTMRRRICVCATKRGGGGGCGRDECHKREYERKINNALRTLGVQRIFLVFTWFLRIFHSRLVAKYTNDCPASHHHSDSLNSRSQRSPYLHAPVRPRVPPPHTRAAHSCQKRSMRKAHSASVQPPITPRGKRAGDLHTTRDAEGNEQMACGGEQGAFADESALRVCVKSRRIG